MKKLTNIQFVEKANLVHDNEYEYLDEYINSRIKLLMRHKICGNEFKQVPNSHISQKHGCPKCFGSERLTNEIVDERLVEQNRNIERIMNYIDSDTKIEWLCLVVGCGKTWKSTPNHILDGKRGCPRCSKKEKLTNKMTDEILKEQNRNIIRLSDINGSDKKTDFQCLECKNVWKATPNNVLSRKTGCSRCFSSKGELEVEKYLIKMLTNSDRYFKTQISFSDCKDKARLRFDFVVYNKNGSIYCIIEYDGVHHFEEIYKKYNNSRYNLEKFEYIKLHDSIKNQYCLDNNIKLIRIPYWKFKNIEDILTKEMEIYNATI